MLGQKQNTKIKILLIEGNPGDAKLVKEMFSHMQGDPIDLEWTGDQHKGLAYLSKESPDLILLDLPRPDRQETNTFVRIREMTRFAPVLVLTGFEDEKMGIEAVRAGAQDFLNKGKITRAGLERCIRYTIERKKVETDIRKSEERFTRLVEQNADGMILVNREGIVVFANLAMQSLTGMDPRDLTGAPFGFPLLSDKTAEIDFYHKQKGPIVAELRVVDLEWDGDTVYLVSLRDITKRKHAEMELKNSQAMLIETEKLGALGTLVAGIAHELNNPMMGMLNYAQYCLKHVPKTSKLFSVLEDMVQETNRCADIVKSLLTFSRMKKTRDEELRKIHCWVLIDRVVSLLKYRIEKENISIKISRKGELPEIMASESNLQQVFLNLIVNALDALSGVKDKIIDIQTVNEAEAICIKISDNGSGIDALHLATIFDPFFTTKSPGKGTGLGLSVCRSIVEAHNGTISCESIPGKGTTFRVRLPLD